MSQFRQLASALDRRPVSRFLECGESEAIAETSYANPCIDIKMAGDYAGAGIRGVAEHSPSRGPDLRRVVV